MTVMKSGLESNRRGAAGGEQLAPIEAGASRSRRGYTAAEKTKAERERRDTI
jgi:hypothetical protein